MAQGMLKSFGQLASPSLELMLSLDLKSGFEAIAQQTIAQQRSATNLLSSIYETLDLNQRCPVTISGTRSYMANCSAARFLAGSVARLHAACSRHHTSRNQIHDVLLHSDYFLNLSFTIFCQLKDISAARVPL